MEVLGAAAAISQFLVQLIATVGLAKKLKGASNSLRQYQERLNDLKLLCEVIRNNPALDTEKVQKETQSILDIIKTHKYVPNLLEKGSFRRAITFILKEQSFGDLFATLEDKKTTLSLVVLSINSLALHDINLRIMSMSPGTRTHDQPTPPHSPRITEMTQQPETAQQAPALTSVAQQSHPKAVYHNNKAGHKVDQHVGHHIIGGIVKCGGVFDIVETKYTKNTKIGDGLQVLGLTYDPLGQEKELDHLPAIGGEWSDNEHERAVEGSESTKQVQGTWVVPRKDRAFSCD